MSDMVTVVRDGCDVQITVEEFNRSVDALTELRANAPIVAHYATRGGKYAIIAKAYPYAGGTCYDIYETTSGHPAGGGGGLMTPDEFAMSLGRRIYFGRKCGTNYKAIIAHAGTELLLKQAEEQATN